MGSGGRNIFDNIGKELGDAFGAVADGVGDVATGIDDTVKGTVGALDKAGRFLGGQDARDQHDAEKKANKAQKKAYEKATKERKDKKALDEARAGAEDNRSGAGAGLIKKKKKGRSGTILTDSLGSVGGDSNQGKKNLLGL